MIRYTVALPSVLLGHVFVGLTLLFWLSRKPRYAEGIPTAQWRPWVLRYWRDERGPYATTIGHGMILPLAIGPQLLRHELFHLEQFEDLCALGWILGLIAGLFDPALGLCLWLSSGAPWLLPNFVTAAVRHKRKDVSWKQAAYRMSTHELGASALTDRQESGRSWWEIYRGDV